MMHGRGKSDLVIVEPDEQGGAIHYGVGGAKGWDQGECELASTYRTPSRICVTQALERIR
jgi:hypothetical protein